MTLVHEDLKAGHLGETHPVHGKHDVPKPQVKFFQGDVLRNVGNGKALCDH